jgi:hypothetical protein
VRLARFDARDHINHRKNARWRAYRFYRALPGLNSPTCDMARFSKPRDFRVFQHYRHSADLARDTIYVCNAFQSGHQKLVPSENLGTT